MVPSFLASALSSVLATRFQAAPPAPRRFPVRTKAGRMASAARRIRDVLAGSACRALDITNDAAPRPGRGGPRGRGPLTCLAVPGLAVDLLHTLSGEPSDVAAGAAFPEATFADAQHCTRKGAGLVGGAWGGRLWSICRLTTPPSARDLGPGKASLGRGSAEPPSPLCLLGVGGRMQALGIPVSLYLAAQACGHCVLSLGSQLRREVGSLQVLIISYFKGQSWDTGNPNEEKEP